MWEILARLGEAAVAKNPVLGLGKDIMAGNVAQGFETFAKRQYGPQMNFAQSMMDPNATGQQRVDAALGMTGVQPVLNMMKRPEDQETGQGLRLPGMQTSGMPIATGMPNYGLLPNMMR